LEESLELIVITL